MLCRTATRSIACRWNLRRCAPHASTERLSFRLGALQLVQPRQRHARGDAREAFADHRRVDEHAVFANHVREMAIVGVEALTFLLEPNPPVQDERRKALARFAAERRRCVEPAPYLRRVDAEEP